MKNRDWNMAIEDREDNSALMNSEVFRNYIKIAARQEQLDLEEENQKKFHKETDEIVSKVYDAQDKSKVPEPIIENLPYDGDDYQEHKQRAEKARSKGDSVYDEFYPDYKVYNNKKNKKASIEDEVMRVLAELEEAEEKETSEPKETKSTSDKPVEHKPTNTDEYKESGAGDSKYLDIGLTSETLRDMSSGIDYCGDSIPGTHDIDLKKTPKQIKEPETKIEKVDDKEKKDEKELDEAEKDLGLDKDAVYIISKMIRRGQ